MELKKHIPFIIILLAILGTWNSTRLEFVDLRTEMRAELGTLSERITVLDQRVSTLSERVARIEGVLSGKVSSRSQPEPPTGAASQSAASEVVDNTS